MFIKHSQEKKLVRSCTNSINCFLSFFLSFTQCNIALGFHIFCLILLYRLFHYQQYKKVFLYYFCGIVYFMVDAKMWEFMAYAAGTGGSCLIIGSAAGVAAMGMENIDFVWYLKRIAWLALIGYIGGALVYQAIYPIFAVH